MALLEILLRITFVTVVSISIGLVVVVGLDRVPREFAFWRMRLVAVLPELIILGFILAFNNIARRYGPDISWILGWEFTDTIYRLEGTFVVWIQEFANPLTTTFFSRIYIYGYIFLLVFPAIAYFVLSDNRPLRVLLLAYGVNYLIGLGFYILIIAYGPRNLLPELVDPLLYSSFPEYQELTRQVNRRVNVFPSLHTSLSMTVVILAYRTRGSYPRWLPLATFIGISVVISTMYLGIHWATDVVAGVFLAWVSVVSASYIITTWGGDSFLPQRFYNKLSG